MTDKTEKKWTPWEMRQERQYLRTLVAAYYDWQRWEISARLRGINRMTRAVRERVEEAKAVGDATGIDLAPRARIAGQAAPVELTLEQLQRMDEFADKADGLLDGYASEISRAVRTFGEHAKWLDEQKGIGPIMAGFLLSQFDPYKAKRPSGYWKFAGLHVVPGEGGRGHSPRPEKGQKNGFAKGVRVKMLGVLGPNLLKACVRSPETKDGPRDDVKLKAQGYRLIDTHLGKRWVRGPYAESYFNYRWRKGTEPGADTKWGYEACTTCIRPVFRQGKRLEVPQAFKDGSCPSCHGTASLRAGADGHLITASLRYMVKMFLLDFWKEQRRIEGLVIVPSYNEMMRGYPHRASA